MASEQQGWIKVHRKFLNWEWYTTPNMVHLFMYLLLSANHEKGKWKGIEVERGQLVTGLLSIKKNTGISIQSTRTCIERLKSTGEITIKSTNKYSVITICNYESYQGIDLLTNKQINNQPNKQLTNNQQTTNNKQEYKNNKNEENKEKEEEKEISLSEIQKQEEKWRIENDRKNREFFKTGEYAEPEINEPKM
jgi:CRISPR/Cas system CSM-associated protein Csm4 (group 5 of RAMP superfamily)